MDLGNQKDLAEDKCFESIQEHKTSDLPLASTTGFPENGVQKDVGKGFWETAGKPLLRRTLIDTGKCMTATIAVIEEPFSLKTVGSASKAGMSGRGGGAPKIGPGGAPGGAPKDVPGGIPGGASAVEAS